VQQDDPEELPKYSLSVCVFFVFVLGPGGGGGSGFRALKLILMFFNFSPDGEISNGASTEVGVLGQR